MEGPKVLPYESQTTTVEGVFRNSVRHELNIPHECIKNAYIIIRLKTDDQHSAVKAVVQLNENDDNLVLSSGSESEEMYFLTHEHGLHGGSNTVDITNLGSISLQFEVTVVTGKIR